VFLEQHLGTFFGDLNFDGKVGYTADIDPAISNFGMANVGWAGGDFNGNGSIGYTTDIDPASLNVGRRGLRNLNPDCSGPSGVPDGQLNEYDLDRLSLEVRNGTNGAAFDFTLDGIVDLADRSFFISDVLGTVIGDVNLSGRVGQTTDYDSIETALSANGYQPILNAGWSQGDMNGDGQTDLIDLSLIVVGQAGAPPTLPPTAIPEPASVLLTLVSFSSVVHWMRRRNR
jgi:hypothetical protein